MTTTTPRVRGRKPGPVTHLADILFDHACLSDDDALNDRATLEMFDGAMDDGVIDRFEASRIRRHLLLDAHMTQIGVSLNLWANRTMRRVEGLVDTYRAQVRT